MATREILIDGVLLSVEVDAADAVLVPASPGLVERGGGLAERGAVADKVRDVGQEMRSLLAAVTRPVREALEATQPDSWSVELNLGFKGEAGIPCITKGEANGSIKVSASWKKAAAG